MSSDNAVLDRPQETPESQEDQWIEVVAGPKAVPDDIIDGFFAWVVPAAKEVEDAAAPAWSPPEH